MVHQAKGKKVCCPKCSSCDVDVVEDTQLICLDCGYEGKKVKGK